MKTNRRSRHLWQALNAPELKTRLVVETLCPVCEKPLGFGRLSARGPAERQALAHWECSRYLYTAQDITTRWWIDMLLPADLRGEQKVNFRPAKEETAPTVADTPSETLPAIDPFACRPCATGHHDQCEGDEADCICDCRLETARRENLIAQAIIEHANGHVVEQ